MSAETISFPPYPAAPDGRDEAASVTVETSGGGGRIFHLTTTTIQRDNAPRERRIAEQPEGPQVRTGSPLFDALFAQAIEDARLNAVSSIQDGAYLHGAPIPCECFKAGERWTYVWTRDVSYAAHLGLAAFDPTRMATTLAYKVSPIRAGLPLPDGIPESSLQIVQDTGSGGSWPVSSDRVSWAFGAEALLDVLHGEARTAFADLAFKALTGTIAADRLAVFDPADGLYRGEQSFLDWRDQTYAPWATDDLTTIATSKALSTNVCHVKALSLATRLAAERGRSEDAVRYRRWADELKAAINRVFWIDERGLYASITTPDSPALPVEKYDMLGLALAIVAGVAPADRALRLLSGYPHAPFGVPVYYPAQPDIFCYHNRAIWPFVTAYELKAAVEVGAVAAADHAADSLIRAAALYLDNVENLEWLTGRTEFDDGPRISSARQLWSVGGYLGMVMGAVFGYRPSAEGLELKPFLTAAMRSRFGDSARLDGLLHHGRRLSITLHLPERRSEQGYYAVSDICLNGKPVTSFIADAELLADNSIDIRFDAFLLDASSLTMLPVVDPLSHDDPAIFSPREPVITDLVIEEGRVRLNFEGQLPRSGRQEALLFTVLRDGKVAARDIPDMVWFDPEPLRPGIRRAYRVVARFKDSGNASHPSRLAVVDGDGDLSFGISSAVKSGDRLEFRDIRIEQAGDYRFALGYRNHTFHIQTGVTNAVKRLTVFDGEDKVVATGIVEMPHMTPVNPLARSTSVAAKLAVGVYRVEIAEFFNMSFLEANSTYISPGGMSGPLNAADIRTLEVVRVG